MSKGKWFDSETDDDGTEHKRVMNLLEQNWMVGTGEMIGEYLYTIEDTKRIER